ncbi:MAG: MotA/TolQ/ExbB proton channel family protein [Phycisphaerae bacterium]|nr:MotA/TolQ/ExbB proton channel family protein [Phycisphaerae bacterium]
MIGVSATHTHADIIAASNRHSPILAAEGLPSVSVLQRFVADGGWITWCILIPLSVVTVALAIHYLLTIRRGTQTPVRLAQLLTAAGRQGQLQRVAELARQDESMIGQATHAGMSRLSAGREAARAAIEEAVEERAMKLLRRVEYLNIIGQISPMIGLFGTVVGMIQAFSRIFAAGGGMPEADKLAGDIAVALVTTFWGLLIAIPALAAFALFRNRIDTYASEAVKLCDGLIALAAETKGPEPPPEGAKMGKARA